jgi:hypothetical protein
MSVASFENQYLTLCQSIHGQQIDDPTNYMQTDYLLDSVGMHFVVNC